MQSTLKDTANLQFASINKDFQLHLVTYDLKLFES
jgi:hypothetical protein